MDYVDPHHKRITFDAASFRCEGDTGNRGIILIDRDAHKAITLVERGPFISVNVFGEDGEFVLRKVQILERPNWLTLDFAENPVLRRITVHIESLDRKSLDVSLREMFGTRSLLYFWHRQTPPNQSSDPTLASGTSPAAQEPRLP